ncbi:MAG: hypothetical protein L0H96_02095 [Humibacillus sp.]|nr:hypothetical protein [Humibacillus sp.]
MSSPANGSSLSSMPRSAHSWPRISSWLLGRLLVRPARLSSSVRVSSLVRFSSPWLQAGTFLPVFRSHGRCTHGELADLAVELGLFVVGGLPGDRRRAE